MKNQPEESNYKDLYFDTLKQVAAMQQQLDAKKEELKLMHQVRAMQAQWLLNYEKQIKDLGGDVEGIKKEVKKSLRRTKK